MGICQRQRRNGCDTHPTSPGGEVPRKNCLKRSSLIWTKCLTMSLMTLHGKPFDPTLCQRPVVSGLSFSMITPPESFHAQQACHHPSLSVWVFTSDWHSLLHCSTCVWTQLQPTSRCHTHGHSCVLTTWHSPRKLDRPSKTSHSSDGRCSSEKMAFT